MLSSFVPVPVDQHDVRLPDAAGDSGLLFVPDREISRVTYGNVLPPSLHLLFLWAVQQPGDHLDHRVLARVAAVAGFEQALDRYAEFRNLCLQRRQNLQSGQKI